MATRRGSRPSSPSLALQPSSRVLTHINTLVSMLPPATVTRLWRRCSSEKGVEVNARDKWRRTPLQLAAWNGNCEVASVLLEEREDIKATAENEVTPLRRAIWNKKVEMAKHLKEAEASLQKARKSRYSEDDYQRNLAGFRKTYDVTKLERETPQRREDRQRVKVSGIFKLIN
jgi:ankyrin repeat protein